MSDSRNSRYKGNTRRLVIAFDVGTTFSGISYCILDPDSTPKICSVTRYVRALAYVGIQMDSDADLILRPFDDSE